MPQTTEIDLLDPAFRQMPMESLKKIIESRADRLEKIEFDAGQKEDEDKNIQHRPQLLSVFTFPLLVELKLCGFTEHDVAIRGLQNVLANSPNLLRLEVGGRSTDWSKNIDPLQLPETACKKLETVDIEWCTSEVFESIVVNCSSLKHITLVMEPSQKKWEQVLNAVFGSNLGLETVDVSSLHSTALEVEQIKNLWRLRSLRSLGLGAFNVTDQTLAKISISFPSLESLSISLPTTETVGQGFADGLAALSSLRQLRSFEFDRLLSGWVSVDEEVRLLAYCCRNLETVRIDDRLSCDTVKAFITCCPRLSHITFPGFFGIRAEADAVKFVQSLKGLAQRDVAIKLYHPRKVWLTEEVRTAIAKMNEGATNGIISIEKSADT